MSFNTQSGYLLGIFIFFKTKSEQYILIPTELITWLILNLIVRQNDQDTREADSNYRIKV